METLGPPGEAPMEVLPLEEQGHLTERRPAAKCAMPEEEMKLLDRASVSTASIFGVHVVCGHQTPSPLFWGCRFEETLRLGFISSGVPQQGSTHQRFREDYDDDIQLA